MKYIVVLHIWFVESKRFEFIEIEAKDDNDAERKGAFLCYKEKKNLHLENISFSYIKLRNKVEMDRKLSWKERILGRTL